MAGTKLGAALALTLAAAVTGSAHAQRPFVYLGGGVTIPVSVYKNEDGAKTGWMGVAGVGVPIGDNGLTLGGEAMYGSNSHEAPPEGDKTNLYGASGWATYRFGDTEKPGIYLLGSIGMLKHDYRSETFPDEQGGNFELAWSGGAGVDIPVGTGGTTFWVEARYMSRGDTRFVPIFAGVSVALGR